LCFTPCKTGYKGVGPLCWGQCNGYYGFKCGLLCVENQSECSNFILNLASSAVNDAQNVAAVISTGGIDIGAWIETYSATADTLTPLLNDGLEILFIY